MKKHLLAISTFMLINFFFSTISLAQYTKILDFAGTTNGAEPTGSLIYDGTYLYGTTNKGGTNDAGIIYRIKPDGTGFLKMHDFGGSGDGSSPRGSLTVVGTFLYGMTEYGGTNNYGTVFKIKPDGTGYAKVYNFASGGNEDPSENLIYDGTYLYGMSIQGGTGSYGTVFKIKPDGTGLTTLVNFNGTNGSTPGGSLISDGTFLYGMTSGGAQNMGNVFKVKPDGTGFTSLLTFNGTNGEAPQASLYSDGTYLYGTTFEGGTGTGCGPEKCGLIFKIKPDGTGYTKVLDFGTTDGAVPDCTLIFGGTYLYGTTTAGGTNYNGMLFQVKPDGTGYSALFNFSGTSNGGSPTGDLILIGNYLYGTTVMGGTNGKGVLYKYQAPGVGITENTTNIGFEVYPNPSTGKISIQNNDLANNNYGLKIYNVIGESIYSIDKFNKQSLNDIDLSTYPKGIYFIKLYDEAGVEIYTEKIILQ